VPANGAGADGSAGTYPVKCKKYSRTKEMGPDNESPSRHFFAAQRQNISRFGKKSDFCAKQPKHAEEKEI
jgi:hypothetical protein